MPAKDQKKLPTIMMLTRDRAIIRIAGIGFIVSQMKAMLVTDGDHAGYPQN